MAQIQKQEGVPRCQYCNRPLRSAEAIKNGFGQECLRKHQSQVAQSSEFGRFLSSHGMSMESFQELKPSDEQYTKIIKMYDDQLERQENPLPTFHQYCLDNGFTEEDLKDFKEVGGTWKGEEYYDPHEPSMEFEECYSHTPFYKIAQQYRREIIEAKAQNYSPIYQSELDYPVEVNYGYLSTPQAIIERAEYNGGRKELRVYTEISPMYINVEHPDIYEVVTFSKTDNGETVATIETIGLQGRNTKKVVHNPQFDSTNMYQQYLYHIKADYEAQVGGSPEIPPESENLDSVFQHGYDCDYPLVKDKYMERGIELQGVRYYDPIERTHWAGDWTGGVMVIKLNDRQDGNVEIRYDIEDGGVTTTIKKGNSTNKFPEGSSSWAFHPTHIKYHELFKETHRDFKEMNQGEIQKDLEHELNHLHYSLQSIERAIASDKSEGISDKGKSYYSKETLKQRYEVDIAKATIKLEALQNKQDTNTERLKQLIREEEAVKRQIFVERFDKQMEDAREDYREYYNDQNPIGRFLINRKLQKMLTPK